MITQVIVESKLDPKNAVLNQICHAGDPWMAEVKKGQIFRIVDSEGNQAVDTLFYSSANAEERYSAVDTIVRQRQLYLTTGSVLYSSEAMQCSQSLPILVVATIHWAVHVQQKVIPPDMIWLSAPCTAVAILLCMRSTLAHAQAT